MEMEATIGGDSQRNKVLMSKYVWSDWFLNVMSKKNGCGGSTLFWQGVWCGYTTFRQAFPRLFTLSKQQGCFVVKMGEWVEGVGV